jgi:hypothetical protein
MVCQWPCPHCTGTRPPAESQPLPASLFACFDKSWLYYSPRVHSRCLSRGQAPAIRMQAIASCASLYYVIGDRVTVIPILIQPGGLVACFASLLPPLFSRVGRSLWPRRLTAAGRRRIESKSTPAPGPTPSPALPHGRCAGGACPV